MQEEKKFNLFFANMQKWKLFNKNIKMHLFLFEIPDWN